jgi:chromate transporter
MTTFSLAKGFATFFKIGLFTIGGGPVMLPLIEREVVERNQWLTKEEFLDLLVVSQSAPGVFAANFAIAIGYRLKGTWGSIVCCAGTVLPSVLCILAIATVFQQLRGNRIVENIFRGIRPAVTALILGPIFHLSKVAQITWRNVWMPIVAALLIWQFGVSPVWVIVAGIAGGITKYFIQTKQNHNP